MPKIFYQGECKHSKIIKLGSLHGGGSVYWCPSCGSVKETKYYPKAEEKWESFWRVPTYYKINTGVFGRF